MARILVAGGAGFLGTHICKELVERGHFVVCADNLCTGAKHNIEALLLSNRFEFREHDVIEPLSIEVDVILNLACAASPPLYQRDPVHTFKTCTFGILNLLDLARTNDAVIFHASTSEIYGDPVQHPQREVHWGNVNPIGTRACYDEGKRGAETMCFDYFREHGTRIKVARIFNTYGPHMNPRDGRVVSNFINQAIHGEPLTIYGTGRQTRSFCYVSDLVRGILDLTFSADDVTGPVNLGNPNEFTLLELAERVLEQTGSKSELVFEDLPSDDPKQRQPDISLARDLLNWEPVVQLEEGLARTIAFFDGVRTGHAREGRW